MPKTYTITITVPTTREQEAEAAYNDEDLTALDLVEELIDYSDGVSVSN